MVGRNAFDSTFEVASCVDQSSRVVVLRSLSHRFKVSKMSVFAIDPVRPLPTNLLCAKPHKSVSVTVVTQQLRKSYEYPPWSDAPDLAHCRGSHIAHA